jgi:hypothetical protein
MALIRNGSHQLAGLSRHYSALGAYGLRSALDSTGKRKNFDSGQHAVSGVTNRAAIPDGFRPPMAWKMGTKAGSLSSHIEAGLVLDVAATILGGKALEGSASLTITTNTPAGELIAFGTGAVTITLATNSPLLTASIDGGGTATFTIDTNTPVLGAEASIVGETTLTISIADAAILPVDDASPLRTATASLTFSGSLVPYAIGSMDGSTIDTSTLTTAAIIAALQATEIPVDVRKVLGTLITGSGTEFDPWGP